MTLRETTTPRGRRFYVDGRRVSAGAMRQLKADAERLDCFRTQCAAGGTVRQFCTATSH